MSKRHVILGHFGPKDTFKVSTKGTDYLSRIDFISDKKKLNFGIDTALKDLVKFNIYPSEIHIDLLMIAVLIQVADTKISRKSESQDSWTREIKLIASVSDIKKWTKAQDILKKALDFLTGDIWSIEFRKRPDNFLNMAPKKPRDVTEPTFDSLSLFSGGLDSLIGAVDILEENRTPLLISHANEGASSKAQTNCHNILKSNYSKSKFDRLRFGINTNGIKIDNVDPENTTRSRSFMFFTIGVVASSGFSKKTILRVPENGLIALNVPLDQLRLGSHSTRTTHPFYIARWNELLEALGISTELRNPYWDKTKGEMVSECKNSELLFRVLDSSLSCSSPTKGRWKKLKTQHCGYCLPCIIRRSALKKGLVGSKDPTIYSKDLGSKTVLDTRKAEGQQVRSFQYAIKRLKLNPNLARILIHNSGPLNDESADVQKALAEVYRRGMLEVDEFLKGIKTIPK